MVAKRIHIFGDDAQSGVYVLRLKIMGPLDICFGRFKKGQPISIAAGECLYVGSAMNGLGRRLVRHACRSGSRPAHPIRETMLTEFAAAGLGQGNLLPSKGKHCRWNIDYLLEQFKVELQEVYIIRTSASLEARLGQRMDRDDATFHYQKGLGANDLPGSTHLLGVAADESWWDSLPQVLISLYHNQ